MSEGMRRAGLIPSFQPDQVALLGSDRPVKVEVPESLSRSRSAFGSLRSRTRRPSMRAYHRPEGCSPR